MTTDRAKRPPELDPQRDPVDEVPAPPVWVALSFLVLLAVLVGYLLGWRMFLRG